MSQTSKLQTGHPGHQCMPMSLFNILVWYTEGFFHQARCIGSTVLLPVTLVLSIGYGGLAIHIWLFEVAKFCWLFDWASRNLSSLTYICLYISPAYWRYIWLLPDLQCMEDITFILWVGVAYPCSFILHIVGQLLLIIIFASLVVPADDVICEL